MIRSIHVHVDHSDNLIISLILNLPLHGDIKTLSICFLSFQDALDLISGRYTVSRHGPSPFHLNAFETFSVSTCIYCLNEFVMFGENVGNK